MAFNKLQIKLLTNSGELLRCINCFAGQVTVLRGYSSVELQPFQRLLAGVQGSERMVATLDSEPYSPAKAILVGFGETFQPGQTVSRFLVEAGVPETTVEMNLMNYGIEVSPVAPCEGLTPDFRRRIRLLAALNAVDQIIVLNNPFEDLASGWRERFAEEITFLARNKNQIVVVPSLSYRPEHWINNDQISRIQVGQNTQRTIGFGSDGGVGNDLVHQIRAAFDSEEKAEKAVQQMQAAGVQPPPQTPTAAPPEVPPPSPQQPQQPQQQAVNPSRQSTRRKARERGLGYRLQNGLHFILRQPRLVLGGCLILLVALLVPFLWIGGEQQPDSRMVKNTPPPVVSTANTATSTAPADASRTFEGLSGSLTDRSKEPAVARDVSQIPPNSGKVAAVRNPQLPLDGSADTGSYVLDLYPTAVRTSVLRAFNSELPVSGNRPTISATSTGPAVKRSGNLFSLLESTSGSGKDLPPTPITPPTSRTKKATSSSRGKASSTLSREEIEERRKRIRQKFLEAIERRAQQRGL